MDSIEEEFLKDRIIYISGDVCVKMSDYVIKSLLYLDKKNPGKEIKLYVNCSPGGEVYAGLSMIDTINAISSPVSVVVMGYVASMASVLASCGTKGKRYIQKGARIMIHQVSSGVNGKNDDIQVAAENTRYLNDYLIDILAKNCGKQKDEVRNDCRLDYWMSADEAVKYGIVDEIIAESNKNDNTDDTDDDLEW